MNNKNNSASNSSTEHIHPFEPFVSKNTKTLILGTFPGKDFTDPNKENDKEDWYYGNKRNEFWELIEYALCCKENSLKTIKEKKGLLEKHNIGITDIIKKAKRKEDNNSDKNLYDIDPNDLNSLLDKYKDIDTIVLTSKDMYTRFFKKYYVKTDDAILKQDKNKKIETYEEQGKKINIYYYTFKGRPIRVVPLHSPARKNVSIKIKKALYKYILKNKIFCR
ncbi:uracil-DNA glycosylase family protein [Treponema denticola]|uniref:Uracil-DNA glycosylase family protein n=1 Tax=Treponema denticola TaxID=158 RepID=A0A9Q9EWU8_TREDN|nr:uracil-DNA glycosylase family protein [Treponema denticola]UTC90615.1 uracil-DNA glycosylase family protein [Treponema denticola]UTD00034.1 uracil-DNA glycosylase family protein [Treponema denticola]